jgi:hypothetical protein
MYSLMKKRPKLLSVSPDLDFQGGGRRGGPRAKCQVVREEKTGLGRQQVQLLIRLSGHCSQHTEACSRKGMHLW